MKAHVMDEYRVSQRVLLTPGVKFKATAGPYYRLADGTRVSLAARGPFTFLRCVRRGKCVVIECLDKDRQFAPLHVEGRRKRITPALVARPYLIRGTVRRTKR